MVRLPLAERVAMKRQGIFGLIDEEVCQKAIIDLRVSSNSKRTLTSLSTCQQLAIFGSLRQTLTANPVWNVKQVQFTSKGADILLLQHLGAYSNGL
ncbi:MAG: hypothetical protein EAZ09_11225 [Oscillatoriales cyanobacterium]|nr:MAG: hypothetical protein EAZ18_06395 [Oscillatoriales cyanobacterium]TAH22040.1 MAG: hypothetical protein EAZ09_11225 [Oscillatoriales cyanobacterium]